jgi:uncharacterized repeat protein (TIGR01451 family)
LSHHRDGIPRIRVGAYRKWVQPSRNTSFDAAALLTNNPDPGYHLDYRDGNPTNQPLCTGDDNQLYGASGPQLNSAVNNTDEANRNLYGGGQYSNLFYQRGIYYEAPGQANGSARLAQMEQPLELSLQGITLSAPTADLSLTNVDSPDPAHVGQELTYRITVTNSGPRGASGVRVTDKLPKTTGFGSTSSSQGTCSRNKLTVSCSLGGLAKGATATIQILVKPTQKGTITNTASVSASQPTDPDPTNNTTTATTEVTP